MSIPYTSSRCEKITKKILRSIKHLTSNYNINLTWLTIKLKNVVTPRLTKFTLTLDKSGVVYKFECDCSQKYIGKTKRRLTTRIIEHNKPSSNSPVYEQTKTCLIFNNALTVGFGEPPSSGSH